MAAEREAGVEKEVEEGANQNPAPIDKDDECRRQEFGWSQETHTRTVQSWRLPSEPEPGLLIQGMTKVQAHSTKLWEDLTQDNSDEQSEEDTTDIEAKKNPNRNPNPNHNHDPTLLGHPIKLQV
jgi:hypothetical protein